jgi:guanine deaminase
MSGLSLIAQEFDLPIQTHLGETLPEIQWVSELFPGSASYTAVYDDSGLLNKRSLMAHGIYFQPEELALIKAKEATLVHCPMANTNISSGVMPLGQYLDQGFRLGLGTDVGAGQGLSMALAITQAVQASKLLTVLRPEEGHRAVKLSEAFYLATVANGRFFAEQGMGSLRVLRCRDEFRRPAHHH